MRTRLMIITLGALIALGGCTQTGSSSGLKILTFNYSIQSPPNAATVIANVQGGQTTIASLLPSNPCNFTADFSGPTPPQVFVYGNPGQTGFNINIVSTDPINIPSTMPPACPSMDEIEINIGGLSEALAVGGSTSRTNGRIWLTDGRKFPTSQFFDAGLDGFNSTNRRVNGDFRFINRMTGGSNTILIVEGSYTLTP